MIKTYSLHAQYKLLTENRVKILKNIHKIKIFDDNTSVFFCRCTLYVLNIFKQFQDFSWNIIDNNSF